METPSYDSDLSRSKMLREFASLVKYRDLILLFISNLNKTRYKRSVLGVAWTLINPLFHMIVLSFAFSQIFRGSIPFYSVYVLIGLIFWNLFSQTTMYAVNSLVWGSTLLRRIYLPRSVFAIASIGNGLVNLGLAFIPLLLIMLVVGHPLYPTWWFVPIAILLLAMFTLGVALLVSTLAAFFVDVVEMYGLLVQAWFFLTPIMYPKEILPARFIWYLNFNPAYNLLELFRTPIVRGVIPDQYTIIAATVSAVFTFLLGWWVFTWKADEYAYRI